MIKSRTLKILALLLLTYGLLWLLVSQNAAAADSPLALLMALPLFFVYAFHKVGVPGLLEHNGLCGWGWCAPTPLGWLAAAAAVLFGFWLMAWAIAALTARRSAR